MKDMEQVHIRPSTIKIKFLTKLVNYYPDVILDI